MYQYFWAATGEDAAGEASEGFIDVEEGKAEAKEALAVGVLPCAQPAITATITIATNAAATTVGEGASRAFKPPGSERNRFSACSRSCSPWRAARDARRNWERV